MIGTSIIRGEYQPEGALHPDKIEQELGVSKTVVREALQYRHPRG
ncbi:GntR family transcriptional regulator [Streptomyces sp. NBC_00322]|nr:GntR family transcriptional regulator [Streptomyces sp. NBC_00322]